MGRKSKHQTIKRHAKRRAAGRFGIDLTAEEHASIVKMIQVGKATFVEKQSLRVSVWDVTLDEQTARVVYDAHRKLIVTFLFPDGNPLDNL